MSNAAETIGVVFLENIKLSFQSLPLHNAVIIFKKNPRR